MSKPAAYEALCAHANKHSLQVELLVGHEAHDKSTAREYRDLIELRVVGGDKILAAADIGARGVDQAAMHIINKLRTA